MLVLETVWLFFTKNLHRAEKANMKLKEISNKVYLGVFRHLSNICQYISIYNLGNNLHFSVYWGHSCPVSVELSDLKIKPQE